MNEVMENGVRAYDLDTSTPLDLKTCLKTFQDKSMYFRLLPSFEDNGFLENLHLMAFCVQVGNFLKFMEKAHSIKGSAAYGGASRVCADCFWIQVCFDKGDYAGMLRHYVSLLEHAAQFRVHWRKCFHAHFKTRYEPKPEDAQVPLPFGYKLEQTGEEEFKVTPPADYLELAEEAERRGK